MPAAWQVPPEPQPSPTSLGWHSSAHTGPLPRSKQEAFATQSVGAEQAAPSAITPSATQARGAPVSPLGGHQEPGPQSTLSGAQTGARSSTATSTFSAPAPTVTITPSVLKRYETVVVVPLKMRN